MSRNLIINSYLAILFVTIFGAIATVTIVRAVNKNQEVAKNSYNETSYASLRNSLLNGTPVGVRIR